jgi:hypothetical protein
MGKPTGRPSLEVINGKVSPEERARLQAIATAEGRTISHLVRTAVRVYLASKDAAR